MYHSSYSPTLFNAIRISFRFVRLREFRLVGGQAANAVTTSHLSPSTSHIIYTHTIARTCERRQREGTLTGARGVEFVIVIARRGRAAIAITARHRSYRRAAPRRAGLLRPVRIFRAASIPARSTSPWTTRIFAPLHGQPPRRTELFTLLKFFPPFARGAMEIR